MCEPTERKEKERGYQAGGIELTKKEGAAGHKRGQFTYVWANGSQENGVMSSSENVYLPGGTKRISVREGRESVNSTVRRGKRKDRSFSNPEPRDPSQE